MIYLKVSLHGPVLDGELWGSPVEGADGLFGRGHRDVDQEVFNGQRPGYLGHLRNKVS